MTQNAQSGTSQTRTYLNDLLGRIASETNPESGTTQYIYDTILSTCFNYADNQSGNLVAKIDAKGNTICYHSDALHRLSDVSDPALSSTCKRFRYDATTYGVNGSAPTGVTVSNVMGRLMEAETDNCAAWPPTPITDEWFSYSARGQVSTLYEKTPHSGGFYSMSMSYWPNGALNTLAGIGMPTFTYIPDGEGRPKLVSGSSSQNPVISPGA